MPQRRWSLSAEIRLNTQLNNLSKKFPKQHSGPNWALMDMLTYHSKVRTSIPISINEWPEYCSALWSRTTPLLRDKGANMAPLNSSKVIPELVAVGYRFFAFWRHEQDH